MILHLSTEEQLVVGQYTDIIFPSYDVRFIAVNDSVDSQRGDGDGFAAASKFMGEAIAKVPVISRSQLGESLIETGGRLGRHGEKRAAAALEGLAQTRMGVTRPFVENIRAVNDLYNKPVAYLFDRDNVYVQQISG